MPEESERVQRQRARMTFLGLGALWLAALLVYPAVGLIFDTATDSALVIVLAAGVVVAALAGAVWLIVRRLRARQSS